MSGTNETCPEPGAGQGQAPPYVEGGLSRSVPQDGGHRKILLSEAASRHLLEAGECFVIAGKSSYPESPGRIVLHLLPLDMKTATAACLVAMGQARAVKIRDPKPKASTTRAGARDPGPGLLAGHKKEGDPAK